MAVVTRQHSDDAILTEIRGLKELFDTRMANVEQSVSRIELQGVKTSERISALEFWRNGLMAKISIVGVILAAIWAYLVRRL